MDRLCCPHLPVPGAGARVVRADALAAAPAEQAVDRLADGLPEDVPERDVDRRVALRLGAAAAPAGERVVQPPGVALDVARLLAEQARGRDLVQVALDGVEVQARLAEADDALVGDELQPAERRQLLPADGDELGQAQLALPRAREIGRGGVVEQDAARALADAVAAVDGQLDPGHEPGGVGRQVERRADEVAGLVRSARPASCGAPRSRSRRRGAWPSWPSRSSRGGWRWSGCRAARAPPRVRARARGCRPWPRRSRRRAAVRRPSTSSRG